MEEGGSTWVSFKYERLPIICYWCGRLDHNERDCPLWIASKGSLKPQDKQFGPFIRASQTVNPRKSVLHVSGFYEDRGGHQTSTVKPMASSCAQTETPSSPGSSGPLPSGEQAGMETSLMAVNAINVDVLPVASRSRIDVELMFDTLCKVDSSSPFVVLHQTNESNVSTNGGSSSMGVAEFFPKTLNPILHPKIAGTYAEGDPFLVKLQEIDRDLQKYDHVPSKKMESFRNQPSA